MENPDKIAIFARILEPHKSSTLKHHENSSRRKVDTLSDKEVVDFFHDTIDPGIGFDPRKFDLTIPQQIIDMANLENNE